MEDDPSPDTGGDDHRHRMRGAPGRTEPVLCEGDARPVEADDGSRGRREQALEVIGEGEVPERWQVLRARRAVREVDGACGTDAHPGQRHSSRQSVECRGDHAIDRTLDRCSARRRPGRLSGLAPGEDPPVGGHQGGVDLGAAEVDRQCDRPRRMRMGAHRAQSSTSWFAVRITREDSRASRSSSDAVRTRKTTSSPGRSVIS